MKNSVAITHCFAPCPCSVPGLYWKEPGPILLTSTLKIFVCTDKLLSHLSLLQAKQAQLPQSFLRRETCQTHDHLCSPALDNLQELFFFYELRSLELDTALQMRPHQG